MAIRWILLGALLAVGVGAFIWWRGGVLHMLPTTAPTFSTTAPALPPLTAEREALLRFEDENLATKVRERGTSSPAADRVVPVPAPKKEEGAVKNENKDTSGGAAKSVSPQAPSPATSTLPRAHTASTSVQAATSTATSTAGSNAATGTPIMTPPSAATSAPPTYHIPTRQFLVDGKGFCNYAVNSSVVLTGYPLVVDATIQGNDIKSWADDRVVFWVPDSVPSGTYSVTVRGVNGWGYCTASTSSPQTIAVQ